jgi:SecD/SecF fusion protein
MGTRNRNLAIIGLVGLLLALALLLIIPGSPGEKPTRLGLDLRGGVELIYQGRPTPQVPKVTPQAINDAIDTIRKRTDTLGVSSPQIQPYGGNEISVGLPAVSNAQRAEQQVGSVAKLQFYDWEKDLLSGNPNQGIIGLFPAVQLASKKQDKPEPTDIPPRGPDKRVAAALHNDQAAIQRYYDKKNDTSGNKFYLFGPGSSFSRPIIRPGTASTGGGTQKFAQANDATAYYESCQEIVQDFEGAAPTLGARAHAGTGAPASGTACQAEMTKLANEGLGPPKGSTVVMVPQGVTIIKDQKPQTNPKQPVNDYFVLQDDSELSGSDITDPKAATNPQSGSPSVTFNFSDKGRAAFARVTKRIAQRGAETILPPGTPKRNSFQHFAITLDNQVVSLAYIDYVQNPDGIDGSTGAEIDNIGTIQDANDLAQNLRIGALSIDLKLISKTQVSATLGKQALQQGLLAGAVGLALTMLFLILFYRLLGLVAGAALVVYAILLFALVKLIPITLTLPGIAGLILTLGVAADANIVIFERVKEEARSGRSIPAAIATGYSKALKAIVDANVVTVGVAFILFMLATADVKGFAFTLGVGTLVSLFTAVVATQAILGSMSRTRMMRSRGALNVGARQQGWRFDFMGRSRWFFSLSGAIIAAGALAIAVIGVNFGIDFESGTRITTPLVRPTSVQQVRSQVLSPLGLGDAQVQKVNNAQLGKNVIQISTHKLEPTRVNTVENKLDQAFGLNRGQFSSTSIGPTFGQQIARTAAIAIITSLILISLYIGLRFDFKFAVPVLIALAHDLLITAGVYALTSREVTAATVAALLTILGYSLYDTIIVFDRIRENVPRMPRATFAQIVNRSMSEVLTRSLVTSFSTLIPIAALMLFGGATLKDFGFALLVGVASGAYSSIFIASPVLTHWKEREPAWQRRRRLVLDENDGVIPAYAEVSLGAPGGDGKERRPVRARAAAARREREAGARTAVQEPPPTTDGVGDGEPPPPPEPPSAPPRSSSTGVAPRTPPRGDGSANGDEEMKGLTPAQRRRHQRRKKRHGRR